MSQVSLGRPEFVPGTPPGHPTAKFLYLIFLYQFFLSILCNFSPGFLAGRLPGAHGEMQLKTQGKKAAGTPNGRVLQGESSMHQIVATILCRLRSPFP